MNRKQWENDVDDLLINRNLHPSQHKVDIINTFRTTLLVNGYWHNGEFGDGLDMINILKDESNLPDIPKGNVRTSIFDIVPSLTNNKTFRAIAQDLTNVKMKGVGVGEILLHLLYKGSNFSFEHDFEVSSMYGELKKFDGGCLKATPDSNFRIVDEAREKYLGDRDFFLLNNKDNKEFVSNNNIDVAGYISAVYPTLNGSTDSWVDVFTKNLDNPQKLNMEIGKKIYKVYQEIDGFDFFVLVKPTKNLDVIIINDVDDEDFVSKNVKFKVKAKRGGDTNAVGDGYAVISGVNVK